MSSTKKKYTAPKFKELVFTDTLQGREINIFQNSIQNRESKLLKKFGKLLATIITGNSSEIKYEVKRLS